MCRLGRRFIAEEKGSVLFEMLLYLAIFSFLLPVVTFGLVTVLQVWNQTADRLEAREQVVTLLRRMEVEVREGSSFAVQPQMGVFSFLDAGGHLVQYQLGAGGLLLRNDGTGVTVIGADVVSCKFSVEAGGQLVHLQVTTKVGKAQETVDQVWTGRGDIG